MINLVGVRTLDYKAIGTLQDELNALVKWNWQRKLTDADFCTAMLSELSEMLDATTWKWWKAGPGEFDAQAAFALKMEVVDIAHFYMSRVILRGVVGHSPSIGDSFGWAKIHNGGVIDRAAFMMLARRLMEREVHTDTLNLLFYTLDMSAEEVSAFYVAKHALNQLRQNGGYRDGRYVKVRDGIEDTQVLFNAVEHFLSTPSSDLATVVAGVERSVLAFNEGSAFEADFDATIAAELDGDETPFAVNLTTDAVGEMTLSP